MMLDKPRGYGDAERARGEEGRNRTVLVLEPRRLAAKAAAMRMAETLGEPVGGARWAIACDSNPS